jgi:NADH-quinone oxidoreductase subunit L
VIAYSTCSQLGYMFVALGVGAYSAGIFHLFTHAFFKALLFLGAGSVIHAMHHEQDLRKMGNLYKSIPVTFVMMLVGTLALTGFPFTAGFFSKDAIIEVSHASHLSTAGIAFILLVVAAFLTSFYSWRLIFMAFFGKARYDEETAKHVHESPLVMLVPLGVLALGALGAGIAFKDYFIGEHYAAFWHHNALFTAEGNNILEEAHHAPGLIVWLPTIMMALGFTVAVLSYIVWPGTPGFVMIAFKPVHAFLYNKWYFDELYDWIFVRPMKWIARVLWKVGDGAIIDGLGPDGIAARVLDIARRAIRLQTGFVYHYAFVMLIGIVAIMSYFAWLNWSEFARGF